MEECMTELKKIDKVIEECSELIQALCKVRRFGWFNSHPCNPRKTNLEHVEEEMCDVNSACERLQEQMRAISHKHYNGE